MRKGLLLAAMVLTVASHADAQHYDLYYGLPGNAGAITGQAAISAGDVSSIGDVGIVPLVVKYGVSDMIEVGAQARLGVLNDALSSLSTVEVGAKYALGEGLAATATGLVPTGDADDPGLSIGLMNTRDIADYTVNCMVNASLLDGYTGGVGTGVGLLIEPVIPVGGLTGYLDILVNSNTDDLGTFGLDLGPNVDVPVGDVGMLNAGVIVGVAGDAKADDIGLLVSLIASF